MKKKKWNKNKINKTKHHKEERKSIIDEEDLKKFSVRSNYN